ncbi:hypothetical protein SAMN05421742_1261, partial [Roseospirillum parvum]
VPRIIPSDAIHRPRLNHAQARRAIGFFNSLLGAGFFVET